jgi:hypothetical protein
MISGFEVQWPKLNRGKSWMVKNGLFSKQKQKSKGKDGGDEDGDDPDTDEDDGLLKDDLEDLNKKN